MYKWKRSQFDKYPNSGESLYKNRVKWYSMSSYKERWEVPFLYSSLGE